MFEVYRFEVVLHTAYCLLPTIFERAKVRVFVKRQGKKIQTAGPLTPEGGIEQPSIGHWSLGAAGPLTPEGGTNPDAMRSKLFSPKKALEIREEGLLLEALFNV